MISFKKAIFALGLGIGMAAGVNSWAAPGCSSCQYMGNLCAAGDQGACANFDRLGCRYYGDPGTVDCAVTGP
jgi:hypothetical protein